MRRPAALLFACLLFCTAFAGAGRPEKVCRGLPESLPDSLPDSLRSLYCYIEGIKLRTIDCDTAGAAAAFAAAIRLDSAYAPAYYELAATSVADRNPAGTARLAAAACRLDSTNKWYLQLYGQALVAAGRYDAAATVYRDLMRRDARNSAACPCWRP